MAEVSLHVQLSQSRSETVYSTMRMSDRPLKSVTISGNHQTADTDLCGEAGGGGARDGLAGDVASEYRVDRVKEAGLSSSDWSNEQNPRLGHRADCGFVAFNVLNQLRPLPVQNKEIKNIRSHIDCEFCRYARMVVLSNRPRFPDYSPPWSLKFSCSC